MSRIKKFGKGIVTPVTIMLVPHSRRKPLRLRIPLAGMLFATVSFVVGVVYLCAVGVHTVEYYRMKDRLAYVTDQFLELQSTMASLKKAERQFRKLFSLKTKSDVLESAEVADTGSLDMDLLRTQIDQAMRSVKGIREYIAAQKDIYLATPQGWPVPGHISSGYGYRINPMTGRRQFHTGVDISIARGTDVHATADGIVSFAGRTRNSGNVIVLEHGHGFNTAYAHNKKLLVKVGDRVTRGEVIARSGSTGRSTGPHVHYEIWKDGRTVNPSKYLTRR